MQMAATYVDPPLGTVKEDARRWAEECGFKGTLALDEATRNEFPKQGHGYAVIVREMEGKQRLATARYDSNGRRTYWSMDGIVTG